MYQITWWLNNIPKGKQAIKNKAFKMEFFLTRLGQVRAQIVKTAKYMKKKTKEKLVYINNLELLERLTP